MSLLVMDWNATRVRAVLGTAGAMPLPLPLEPPAFDLPLAIGSGELAVGHGASVVGSVALRHARLAPHLVSQSFLPHLDDPLGHGKQSAARDRPFVSAHDACSLVWKKLQHLGSNCQGVLLNVPGYMQSAQAAILRKLGVKANVPVLGSTPTVLTAALACHNPNSHDGSTNEGFKAEGWRRSVLVVDIDDHALTLGWVKALAEQAHLIECRVFPSLGLKSWREHLIDTLAELFIWQHRRDPRDAPLAEQCLYDQLEPLVDAAFRSQAIELGVQGSQWYKHLHVHPEQTLQFCQPLVRQASAEADSLLACWPASESPRQIVITYQAARLPGLLAAMHNLVLPTSTSETKLPVTKLTQYDDEDLGEDLMFPQMEERGGVVVLSPEAPARAAHRLAALFLKGDLPTGHVETTIPLESIAKNRVEAGRPLVHGP